MLASVVLFLPTSWSRSGNWIPNIVGALQNSGQAYYESLRWQPSRPAIVEYVRLLLAPLLAWLLPLTVYYWRDLKPWLRVTGLVASSGMAWIYVSIGMNAGVADFALILPCMVAAACCAGRLQLRLKQMGTIAVVAVILMAITFSFFTAGQISRQSIPNAGYYFPFATIQADTDNFLVRHLPPFAQAGVVRLAVYLTQGYYAVYLSLNQPFVPTYGVGHSLFLARNVADLIGNTDLLDRPYPIRIEADGWNAQTQWSSIYPWIASDVTFPGTVLVMLLFGFLFGKVWNDVLDGRNPFAVALIAQLFIALFYFPANNQLAQGGEDLIAFYGTLFAWLWTRRQWIGRSIKLQD